MMDLNMCSLTQDLLLLYAEDLLSPETRQVLEVHARRCPTCAKALADLDSPLPPALEAMEVDATEEPARLMLGRLRRGLYYGVLGLVLLVLVVGAFGYQLGGRSSSGPVRDVPLQVASSFDLAQRVVPGWERAAAEGLLVELNQTLPIPGSNATITLEQVWYGEERSYLLYTVRAPEGEHLAIGSAHLDDLPAMVSPATHWAGGFSAEGFHQVLYLRPQLRIREGSELELSVPIWHPVSPNISHSESRRQRLYRFMTTQLPVPEGVFAERFERYVLDQAGAWLDRRLTLEELAIGLRQVQLTVLIDLPEGEVNPELGGTLLFGGAERGLTLLSRVETEIPGRYRLTYTAQPLDRWPVDVDLKLWGIGFAREEPLLMELPWGPAPRSVDQLDLKPSDRPWIRFYDGVLEMIGTYDEGRGFHFNKILPEGLLPQVRIGSLGANMTVTAPNGHVVDNFGSGGGPTIGRRESWSFHFDESDESKMGEAQSLLLRIEYPEGLMIVEEQWPLNLTPKQ